MANSWYDEALKKQKRGKGFKAFKHTKKKIKKSKDISLQAKRGKFGKKKKTLLFFSQ